MESVKLLRHYRHYLGLKHKLEQNGHINVTIYSGRAALRHDTNLIGHYHRYLDFLQSEPQLQAAGHLPFDTSDKRVLFESLLPREFWNTVKHFYCFNK